MAVQGKETNFIDLRNIWSINILPLFYYPISIFSNLNIFRFTRYRNYPNLVRPLI